MLHEVNAWGATFADRDDERVKLATFQSDHPLWTCRLFHACREGQLDRRHFAKIFGQYFFYTKNFTRYLAALMANLDDENARALLAQNLWEETGGCDTVNRHSTIYREFLRDGLDIEVDALQPLLLTTGF